VQASHCSKHGLVLGGPRHDYATFRETACGAEEGKVHGLGAGCGERDLRAIGAQRLGGCVARVVQGGAGGSSFCVRAGRVAVGYIAKRFDDFAQDRRRAGVVEKDAATSRGWDPAAG
jgi:hypothetical protein